MKTPENGTPATRGRVSRVGRLKPAQQPAVGPKTSASARAKIAAAAPPPPRGVTKLKRLAAVVRPQVPIRSQAAIPAAAPRAPTGSAPSTTSRPPSGVQAAALAKGGAGSVGSAAARVALLEAELQKLSAELQAQAEDNASLTRAVEEANESAAAATAQAAAISRAATEQVAAFEAHIAAQQAALAEQAARADAALAARARELAAERVELQAVRLAAAAAAKEHADQIHALRAELLTGERVRREIHNQLHELRGNIRILCRLRPALPAARAEAGPGIWKVLDAGRSLELGAPAAGGKENCGGGGPPAGSKWSFSFDKVLGEAASQASVFAEVEPLCQSALDGFRVAIFAYGQTGSGKTHTMLGQLAAAPPARGGGAHCSAASADALVAVPSAAADGQAVGGTGGGGGTAALPEGAGVIPRALALLFSKARQAAPAGWAYSFEASLLEVYNDELRDLLPESGGGATGSAAPPKLELRHERSGDVSVPGLTVHAVRCEADAALLLERASGARATARTGCNEHSSRSHSVFVLRVAGVHAQSGEAVRGSLTLVDLAGSERVKESGVAGARLREAQAINKSLSALGDVIAALASKERHIPYRNSKLTALLQPSLGGGAKALMVVNVASEPACWNESLCSLRFAQKASGVSSGAVSRLASSGAGGGNASAPK